MQLTSEDEIVLSTCNHSANFDCWLAMAERVACKVVLWDIMKGTPSMEGGWKYVEGAVGTGERMPPVTNRTKLLIVPHTSNVLGVMLDLDSVGRHVKRVSPSVQIIVDGVAAVPHRYAGGNGGAHADHYVVSCHKLFGPHLGVCVSRRGTAAGATDEEGEGKALVERGTMNFEACNGVVGLLEYFLKLASISVKVDVESTVDKLLGNGKVSERDGNSGKVSERDGNRRGKNTGVTALHFANLLTSLCRQLSDSKWLMMEAYENIELAESSPMSLLLDKIRFEWKRVKLISVFDDDIAFCAQRRVPVISFVHESLSSDDIVKKCEQNNIVVRAGFFLSTECINRWAESRGVDVQDLRGKGGAVRVSLAHYNTMEEVLRCIDVMESMEGWG